MKWLFGALLLANIAFFMWASWYKEPVGEAARLPGAPVNAEKMRLLSEPGVVLRPRVSEAPPENQAPVKEKAKSLPTACFTVGPFMDVEAVGNARAILEKMRLTYRERVGIETTVSAYRAYAGPLASRDAAVRRSRQIAARGIKDREVIQLPDKRYAVSLGVYAREENTQTRIRTLAKKGIKARQQVLHRDRQVRWLDLPAQPITREALAAVDWGADTIQAREASCPDTKPASGQPTPKSSAAGARKP